jgi:hypothetical protein
VTKTGSVAPRRGVVDLVPALGVMVQVARLHAWLRRIDRWIAYANSVVEE